MAITERAAGRNQLRVGRLVKAHGLKGALKLELYTDDPGGRFVPGAAFTLQVPEASPWHGKTLTVREYRVMNGNSVVFFEGVEDRTAAEGLVKAILWIDQDDAEEPEDDAWYDHQLVGLDVVRDDVVIGRVIRVEHLPAQDLLIVRPSAGSGATEDAEVMVPFVSAIVPTVDIAAGRIIVTPPPGLFEEHPRTRLGSTTARRGPSDRWTRPRADRCRLDLPVVLRRSDALPARQGAEHGILDLPCTTCATGPATVTARSTTRPYGGGAGMVMKPEPWGLALDALATARDGVRPTIIFPSPAGEVFTPVHSP